MEKMFIEARVNEFMMRDVNSKIPWSPDELAEEAARCREAGATIFHYHARTDDGGPDNSLEKNREIIRKIRNKSDILIHTTLGFTSNDMQPKERIDRIVELGRSEDSRPDIVPIDMGSLNFEKYDSRTKTFTFADRVYKNPTDVIMYSAEQFTKQDYAIQLVCWGPGFVRRAGILMELGILKSPGFFLLNLIDGPYITGHGKTPMSLNALIEPLPMNRRAVFSVNCTGGGLFSMIPYIAQVGGNISIGLGDYEYPEYGAPDNATIVSMAAAMIRENKRELATLEETRAMVGASSFTDPS